MSDDTISIKIKLKDAAKFAGETRIASVEIDELGNAAERANKKSRRAGGGFAYMERSLGFLKPTKAKLLAVGIGLIIQALSAGATGATAFVSALAPLGGLLGALPAAAVGAAQGLGVMKLAFLGVGGALGGLHAEIEPKKFAALTGPAQQFVLLLQRMKAPVIAIQRAVQGRMFAGLTTGLKAAAPALTALSRPLAVTGGIFGAFGEKLGRLVGSKGFLADLRSQAQFNNVQFRLLSNTGIRVVDIFRQLTVGARPLVHWLVLLAGGWAATADKTLIADRRNGKMAATFHTVERVTGRVLKILWNTGVALFHIGELGRKNLGEGLLSSLAKGSESLRRWTESRGGIEKIGAFFRDAKPAVYAFAKLVAAIALDFLKLGSHGGNNLAAIFEKLRTQALPVILKITEGVTKILGLIARIPGGGVLLGAGFLASRLGGGGGGGGLFGGVAQGVGFSFGKSFSRAAGSAIKSGLETAALKGLYMQDAFMAAGTALATPFAAAFVAGLAAAGLGVLIGKVINDAFPNGLFGHPERKTSEVEAGIAGLRPGSKAMRVENGELKPNRGYPHTHLGGTPAHHGAKVHVFDRAIKKWVWVTPGETLPGPRHAGIAHASANLQVPTTADVRRSDSWDRAGQQAIHVHTHTTLKLDSKPVAEGTGEVVARRKALA